MNLLKVECKKCGGMYSALPGSVYCLRCTLVHGRDLQATQTCDACPTSTQPLVTLTNKQIKLIEHAEMFGGEVLGVTVHIKFPINSCTISPDGKTNWIKE